MSPHRPAQFWAQEFHRFLRSARFVAEPGYDGDRTVTAGHVRVHFNTHSVEVSFIDPYADPYGPAAEVPVVVYIPGQCPFGAVATVVEGLCLVLTPAGGA